MEACPLTEILFKSYFIIEFSASVLFHLNFPIHPQTESKTLFFKNIKKKTPSLYPTLITKKWKSDLLFSQNVKSDVAEFHFLANMKAVEDV